MEYGERLNLEKYRASEREYIQSILAWQVAQTLGYEDEESAKERAVLLLVDYDDNIVYPQMVGRAFLSRGLSASAPADWNKMVAHIARNYVCEDSRMAVTQFWSEEAARMKFEKRRVFDAINFLSAVDGAMKWVHEVQYLLEDPDTHHLLCYCWAIVTDTFRKNQAAIVRMAQHDPLTGLYNRHKLHEFMSGIENGNGAFPMTIILADINLFKRINDDYGHNAGDRALKTLAARLEDIFPRGDRDMIFRLGGDEFLVIMQNTAGEQAPPYLEKAASPIPVQLEDGSTFEISLSIGYAVCNALTDNLKSCLKAADEALYAVKKNGRFGYRKGTAEK